jgi:hypothetical protein
MDMNSARRSTTKFRPALESLPDLTLLSSSAVAPIVTAPNNVVTPITAPGESGIYMLINGETEPIASGAIYAQAGSPPAVTISHDKLHSYPGGPWYTAPPVPDMSIIEGLNDPKIYLVHDGAKEWISTEADYAELGSPPPIRLTAAQVVSIPTGPNWSSTSISGQTAEVEAENIVPTYVKPGWETEGHASLVGNRLTLTMDWAEDQSTGQNHEISAWLLGSNGQALNSTPYTLNVKVPTAVFHPSLPAATSDHNNTYTIPFSILQKAKSILVEAS